MCGYQLGDEVAAGTLIERLTPLLLRYFLAQGASRSLAEDLTQETWMRIHRGRHTYRPGAPLRPWVFAIARHIRLDAGRKIRRIEFREQPMDLLPEPATHDPRVSREGLDLHAILAKLPPSQREVIVMLKISGMTIEEVARATASTVGSVKQKVHRAYGRLRDLLRPGVRSR